MEWSNRLKMKRILFLILSIIVPISTFADDPIRQGYERVIARRIANNSSTSSGAIDTFEGVQSALATHNSNWVAATDGVANIEIDGSGNARLTGNYRSGSAYYNTTPTDISIVTVGGASTNAYFSPKSCVRMSGSANGYCIVLMDNDGSNWTDIGIFKNSSQVCYLTGTYSASQTHVLKITASGTSPVILEAYIDGAAVGSCDYGSKSDSDTPLTSGYSGFGLSGGSASDYANNFITEWRDYD